MTKKHVDILLINPPFGTILSPHISIPVLAAYLQNRSISLSAYDMKREVYIKLLTPQNIFKSLNNVKTRFLELNSRAQLNFGELYEYEKLTSILSELRIFKRDMEKLRFPFADFSDVQNSKAIHLFIQIATFPYFPEIIIPHYSYGELSAYNPFSSADILKASRHESYYVQLFQEILYDQILSLYEPRIIGFSIVFTNQIIPAFQCARIIKHRLPHVHLTMGGPCISSYFREIQEKRIFTLIDSLVLDEGEIPLEILAKELSGNNPNLSEVPGFIYLSDNEIHVNPPAPPVDMEQSPPPDYTVFQLDKYLFTGKGLIAPFRLSKGCPWQKCTFCRTELYTCRNYQQPSMEMMYQQLLHVIETAGITSFFFSDENADPAVLEYISRRLVNDQVKIQWLVHTRISKSLTKKRCELYRKAGCINLRVGVESFSDRILKLMRKRITVRLIEHVLKEIGGVLPIVAYMMVGFPTETEEEARTGYEKLNVFLSKGFVKTYTYALFGILYGSDIWKHQDKYGITEIHIPDRSDLSVDIIDFKSPGMSRERAYQLQVEFNRPVKAPYTLPDSPELQINGELVPLRYSLQEARTILEKNGFTLLPFVEWLQKTDAVLYPTRT